MSVEKYVPLNFRLLLQPLNWIIILLMLAIAGFAGVTAYNFVVSHVSMNKASEQN